MSGFTERYPCPPGVTLSGPTKLIGNGSFSEEVIKQSGFTGFKPFNPENMDVNEEENGKLTVYDFDSDSDEEDEDSEDGEEFDEDDEEFDEDDEDMDVEDEDDDEDDGEEFDEEYDENMVVVEDGNGNNESFNEDMGFEDILKNVFCSTTEEFNNMLSESYNTLYSDLQIEDDIKTRLYGFLYPHRNSLDSSFEYIPTLGEFSVFSEVQNLINMTYEFYESLDVYQMMRVVDFVFTLHGYLVEYEDF